jgi:hypothetical protein
MHRFWMMCLAGAVTSVGLLGWGCDLGLGSDGDGVAVTEDVTAGQGWVTSSSSGWEEHAAAAPCRPNALWFDDRQAGLMGCGDKAQGAGLWTTSDGGESWQSQENFSEIRVNDIRRAPDGLLYGAGQFLADEAPAFSIDEGGPELGASGLYVWGDKASTKVGQAENIVVAADGQVLLDSLTGTTAAYKPAGGDFTELHGLGEEQLTDLVPCVEASDCGSGVCKTAPECPTQEPCCGPAPAYQVRSMASLDNQFYACGSLINDPARVRLPSKAPGATFHFETLVLQDENEDGELLDMHLWSETKMIVVGSDQSGSQPLIFVLDGDPYSRASWSQIHLVDDGIEWDGRAFDVSVAGDRVVVVGEKSPSSKGGFIIASEDRGLTWYDATPDTPEGKIASLEKVWLFEDGDVIAMGETTWVFSGASSK